MLTNKTQIAAALNLIAERVQKEINCINSGGCAIYAVELAKRLEAIVVTDYKIRTYAYQGMDKTNVSTVERKVFGTNLPDNTYDWNKNGVHFTHVRLEWNGKVWDAEGTISARKARVWENWYVRQRGYISRKAMEAVLGMQSNWNRMFDRKQVPNLKAIMDSCFLDNGLTV